MNQIADSMNGVELRDGDDNLEGRLLRSMAIATAIAVIVSAVLAPWRVTSGLFLGGSLSLLNYHWLHTSVAAIFNIDLSVQRPRARSRRYLLRYFVVGLVVLTAYKFHLVALAATLAGLCSLVPALFVEAARQFYFSIIHREESF
jgi:ATP synthase I chain